jgi:hypothetical protein
MRTPANIRHAFSQNATGSGTVSKQPQASKPVVVPVTSIPYTCAGRTQNMVAAVLLHAAALR